MELITDGVFVERSNQPLFHIAIETRSKIYNNILHSKWNILVYPNAKSLHPYYVFDVLKEGKHLEIAPQRWAFAAGHYFVLILCLNAHK